MADTNNLKQGRRLLGLTMNGKPIFEHKPCHSLLLSAAGGGKTTCGAVPWLQSMISDTKRTLVITDVKDGEIAAQTMAMCAKYNRKVALIDDSKLFGSTIVGDHPFRVTLNPYGGIISAHEMQAGELVFATDNANHALIEEPPRDQRNAYWRDEPRTLAEFAQLSLLKHGRGDTYPGAVWSLLSGPELLQAAISVGKNDRNPTLRALSHHVEEMQRNREHFSQHRGAALKALRIFSAGSPLHHAGANADKTHLDLLAQNYVIFIVGPQRHMERLGPYFALHLQSFMEALLATRGLVVDFILDEFTNAPLKELVSRLTTMRAYGGNVHMVAQSRSEIERKYGDKETLTIEENAVIKQWFGFSSFTEAERVSKAIGEALHLSQSMGFQSDKIDFSGNLNKVRERLFTPEELMRLPSDEQIIHIKDVGFIHAKKIRQNEIAPYCDDLDDNPLEGSRLKPQAKIDLSQNQTSRATGWRWL